MIWNNTQKDTLSGNRLDILICIFLGLLTFAAYCQVINHKFVWDDGLYITNNEHVQRGLTTNNVLWAFSAEVAGNWHPLTLLSHMLDCQLHGLNPGRHHITSLIFHLINTILLFIVFKKMTNALWQSAFVAALFALHPLHVESVAWVAERKDVLSTFFWMLTMWAYVRYVEHPDGKRYIPVLVFFALGLAAKQMLVTLPFVLILLDFWPLERLRFEQVSDRSVIPNSTSLSRIIFEKTPFFVFSAISCIITYNYQQSAGATKSFEIPFYGNISNAFVSYITYIYKMIWPFKLAAFYPHPGIQPLWTTLGAFILLVIITCYAIRSIKRSPFFAVGWFWYLGTLVPVIGFVQVGEQAMADRYTYIPLVGIFIIFAWGIPELLSKWRYENKFLSTFYMSIILFLIPLTWMQVKHWENGITLFQHALDVTDENVFTHHCLGSVLAKRGLPEDLAEATKHFNIALQLGSENKVHIHFRLAEIANKQNNLAKAIKHLNIALQLHPEDELIRLCLGSTLAKSGRFDEAKYHFDKALKINPNCSSAHKDMGNIFRVQGKIKKAIYHFTKAIEIDPDDAKSHKYLGDMMIHQENIGDAITLYSTAIKLDPDFKEAQISLGKAHFMMGNISVGKGEINEAIDHFQKSLQLNYNSAQAHTNLGYALLTQGREDEAKKYCLEAIHIDPEKSINAYYNLACISARRNHKEKSADWLEKAINKGFNDWKTLKADKDLENIRDTAYYSEILKNM